MARKTDKYVCSNCGGPFHGLSQCIKPTIDGNDEIYLLIEQAADKLVDLIRLCKSRGNQPGVLKHADELYTQVLRLNGSVNTYAQQKESK